jgi:hypothetical protein
VIVQSSDPLRDDPVEPPYLGDHRRVHFLILVRERPADQPARSPLPESIAPPLVVADTTV